MDIEFPVEFVTRGTPVSFQAAKAASKIRWKERVLASCREVVDPACFAFDNEVSVVIYYFSAQDVQGDVDNIAKLIIDALEPHVLVNDSLVESLIVRRFKPGILSVFENPPDGLVQALGEQPPFVYVRLEDVAHAGDL